MSIIRLIHIKIDPSKKEQAERVWKTGCAPLMIQQKGCISEKLLRSRDAGEFISYSEWESEHDIERYLSSEAHKEIVRHSRELKGTQVVVKLYDLVNQTCRDICFGFGVQGQLRHADYINNWLRIEKTPTSDGFGSILVPRSIVGQLGGKLDYTWKPEGFSAFISS